MNACRLENRSLIRVSGADRRTFLQGLISNDIALCAEDRAIYAALLTPQGKFLHDLFIVDSGDAFLIDCEVARADDLLTRLKAYKLRAKVTFENAAAEFDVWAGWNETVAGSINFPDPRLPELGSRFIVKKNETPSGISQSAFSDYDRHRLSLGVTDGSRDMQIEKSTLSDGNFDLLNGISWSKGCYIGQELTARMHYRALVKKRMFPVTIEGPAPVPGSILKLNGAEAGEMRSASGDRGLALLNMEKAEQAIAEKMALECGSAKLTVTKPSWMND